MIPVSHLQLWELLASGATVITVNNRLARYLEQQYALQVGPDAWETLDILPWNAWLGRQYQVLTSHGAASALPLSAVQEKLLWEAIANRWNNAQQDDTRLLRPTAAADNAATAWQLVNNWRLNANALRHYPQPETRLLCEWIDQFEASCRENALVSQSRIPHLLIETCGQQALPLPSRLVLAGFDEYTPVQQLLFDTFQQHGCELCELIMEPETGATLLCACPTPEDELEIAAAWAANRLQARPDETIGIVVRDLQQQVKQVERIFRYHFHPERITEEDSDAPTLYNISLGLPLAEQEMVHDAVLLLRLCHEKLNTSELSRLMQSRHVGDYSRESNARANLDLAMRRYSILESTLRRLQRNAENGLHSAPAISPALAQRLAQLVEIIDTAHINSYATAAKHFTLLLQTAGWPGDASLNSHEYQVREQFTQLLDSFSRLDRVAPFVSASAALKKLIQMATETPFQRQGSEAPVQVMGLLEAGGMRFDAAWISGMTLDHWPPASQPNPMLPLSLQAELGMPRSSASRELTMAEITTKRLRQSAPEVIFSHAMRDGDSELLPSRLVANFTPTDLGMPVLHPMYNVPAKDCVESTTDNTVSPLNVASDETPIKGGVGLLGDQASCPFRALARHRLKAELPQETVPGVDAITKGSLLHQCLELTWKQLGNSARLQQTSKVELQQLVTEVIDAVLTDRHVKETLGEGLASLEAKRLQRLLMQWYEFERNRAPFTVIDCETEKRIDLNGLPLTVRIDRIDELQDGSLAIIDYKSGKPAKPRWNDERLEEPQLPLYATVTGNKTSAALLAFVNYGQCQLNGLMKPGTDFSERGVKESDDWEQTVENWRNSLSLIAEEIRAGRADITPSQNACQYCELDSLCRREEYEQTENLEETTTWK